MLTLSDCILSICKVNGLVISVLRVQDLHDSQGEKSSVYTLLRRRGFLFICSLITVVVVKIIDLMPNYVNNNFNIFIIRFDLSHIQKKKQQRIFIIKMSECEATINTFNRCKPSKDTIRVQLET